MWFTGIIFEILFSFYTLPAFENGTLSEKEIDEKLSKLLCLAERFNQATENTPKTEIDIEKVVRYTAESFVLLKNNGILPLGHNEKILIVGGAAREPRIQGGGCANLGCEKISSPLDEIRMFHPKAAYIESYELSETQFQAVNDYDKIVVFLSLGDRKSTRLNSSHLKLSRMPSSA